MDFLGVVKCSDCNAKNDLTALHVTYGHVYDCEACGKQQRAVRPGAPMEPPQDKRMSREDVLNALADQGKEA